MAKALAAKDAVSTRMRSIRRVLWIVLVLNLAVAAAKYVYGTVTGSASMQADGIHSVFDSAGNVVEMCIRDRSMGLDTAAVVAMADDGGSTGVLREEANVTPPGDVRKCLAAMAADPADPLTRALKYRLSLIHI